MMLRLTLLTAIILGLLIDVLRCDENVTCDEEGVRFRCKDGSDIDCLLLCDGKKDCPDGSDEFLGNDTTSSPCRGQECKSNFVACNYGPCIPVHSMCDLSPNCADGSDEWKYNCTKHPIDPDGMKACESGDFIEANKFCDGKIDCPHDESDERPFQCLLIPCPKTNYFRCDSGGCINKSKECDQKFDCHDHSDEKDCENPIVVDSIAPKGCEIEKDLNYYVRNLNENSNIFTGEKGRVPVDTDIVIKCKNNFFFSENKTEIRRTCTENGWNFPLPHCIKYCDSSVLHSSISTVVKCKLRGSIVDCQHIEPGTIAEVSCADGYQMPETISDWGQYTMTCTSGAIWSAQKINCQPICGRSIASASEAPWHVGVKTYLDQKCGGTIVSPKSVITALHCVQDEDLITLNANKVFVTIAGDLKDGHTHTFTVNVSEIVAEGDIDVAILKLSETLTLNMNIRPICIAENGVTAQTVRTFLHGWTENRREFTDIFRRTELEVLPLANCGANLNRRYMCVRPKYYPGRNEKLCEGHSGSGIIKENLYGVNYIIGIVSYNPSRVIGCTNEPVVAILFDQIPRALKKSIVSDKEATFTYVK